MSTAAPVQVIKIDAGIMDQPGARDVNTVMQIKIYVQEIMKHVLIGPEEKNKSGVHYGPPYPGSKKWTLKLPGAQTLASTFGISIKLDIDDLSDFNQRRARYRVKVRAFSRSGLFLGEGIGECSTDEEKYQWEKALNEEHFLSFEPHDRRKKFKKIWQGKTSTIGQEMQVRASFADKANTVLKIAKKRGLVDVVILVLDCSDLFDQDLDELMDDGIVDAEYEDLTGQETEHTEAKPKEKQQPVATLPNYGQCAGLSLRDPKVNDNHLTWYLNNIKTSLGKPGKEKFVESDKQMMKLIEEEQARRAAAKKPAEPVKTQPAEPQKPAAEQSTASPQPAQQTPTSIPPQNSASTPSIPQPTESEWQAFVGEYATSHHDLFLVLKEEFQIEMAKDLKPELRGAFILKFQEKAAAKK